MKLINFRKIGTVLAVAVFGFISFTAGVDLTQNANSAGSSSVLPVLKGGTGNNYGNVPSADKLYTARNINDVAFDGTKDIDLPGTSHSLLVDTRKSELDFKFDMTVDMNKGFWYGSLFLNFSPNAGATFYLEMTEKLEYVGINNVYMDSQSKSKMEIMHKIQTVGADGAIIIIRINNLQGGTATRPLSWSSYNKDVVFSEITDPDEINQLNNPWNWKSFNEIIVPRPTAIPSPPAS
jgi:hypothetical protein